MHASRRTDTRGSLRLDLLDAYNDGTTVGFFLGIAAATLGWAILSGFLVGVLVALVDRVLLLARLGGG